MEVRNKLITKQGLVTLIGQRLKNPPHRTQIRDVLGLFFDEFVNELNEKKKINISGFCTFYISKNKSRKYYDLYKQRFAISTPRPLLKIKLDKKLYIKIIKNIDLIKTFM